jgi:hypothetical protein
MSSSIPIHPAHPDIWRVSVGQDSGATRTVDLTLPVLSSDVSAALHKAQAELLRSAPKRTVRVPLDLTLKNGMCLHVHPVTGHPYTLLVQHIEHMIAHPIAETRCEGICIA